MGKALLLVTLAFTTIFSTMTLNSSRHGLESVRNYSRHHDENVARNAASSGVYMAFSNLYQNSAWRTGFTSKTLGGGDFDVTLQDNTMDSTLSSMELRIVSSGSYENISKSISVVVGIPPDLGDLSIFCTDTIVNVSVNDENGIPDPSLVIQNAPSMLPFDKPALEALAVSQGHVIAGDFVAPDNYPTNNYYYDVLNQIPNVTHVQGDFTIQGNTTAYGIYIVEGNARLDGAARLDGVLYLPNPSSIVIHGGGDPKESNVTGGIFANGTVDGLGNHISVTYDQDYMEAFAAYQTKKNMFIISWRESPTSS